MRFELCFLIKKDKSRHLFLNKTKQKKLVLFLERNLGEREKETQTVRMTRRLSETPMAPRDSSDAREPPKAGDMLCNMLVSFFLRKFFFIFQCENTVWRRGGWFPPPESDGGCKIEYICSPLLLLSDYLCSEERKIRC